MNLLVHHKITAGLLIGLFFLLLAIPAPASAAQDKTISCSVNFDWTYLVHGTNTNEVYRTGKSDNEDKTIYTSSTAPHFRLKLLSNSPNAEQKEITDYDKSKTGYTYSTNIFINQDNPPPYRLYICGNRRPGAWFWEAPKCATLTSIYPTCKTANNASQKIKNLDEYETFAANSANSFSLENKDNCKISFSWREKLAKDTAAYLYQKEITASTKKLTAVGSPVLKKGATSVEFTSASPGDYTIDISSASIDAAAVCPASISSAIPSSPNPDVPKTSFLPTPAPITKKDQPGAVIQRGLGGYCDNSVNNKCLGNLICVDNECVAPTSTSPSTSTKVLNPTPTISLSELSALLKKCKGNDFSKEKRESCNSQYGLASLPPEDKTENSTPTNISVVAPTATPTTAQATPTPTAQPNNCSYGPREADFDNSGTVDIKDFNKVRDCLVNSPYYESSGDKKIVLVEEFMDWTKLVWTPAFLGTLGR